MERWIDETVHASFRARIKADRVLHEVQTEHQHLVIFENPWFGKVMLLDGVVQLTTADEFCYHEMLAHTPLFALGNAQRVLIIGGGDGGIMREVLKHPGIEKVTLCEIDRGVIDMSLKYLPEISAGAFDDPRADVVIADGVKYVAESREPFDAIIVDSTEPIGPAAVLFTEGFFASCAKLLGGRGVLANQNGLPFMMPQHLTDATALQRKLFKDATVYLCSQPTYFGGPFALAWASDDESLRQVSLETLRARFDKAQLTTRYYTPEVHLAAFALPPYIQALLPKA